MSTSKQELFCRFVCFFLSPLNHGEKISPKCKNRHHGAATHKKKVGTEKKAGGKLRVADRNKAFEAR